MGPADLAQVLRHLPSVTDPNFLGKIGDDAVVYRLNDQLAVVQTIDFITPVVNDPYDFGQVAAANALSDLYAMGATPVFALNLIGFPVRSLPLGHMEQIMLGGAAKVAEAGAVIAGGHSIEDYAPKYGLAVTGVIDPTRLITKAGGQEGDLLFLTKPLGSGIITTAFDQGLTDPELERRVIRLMTTLNRGASEAMVQVGATACTDVTGFGLLGHVHELAKASGLAAAIDLGRVPVMPEAHSLVARAISNGTRNNHRFAVEFTQWAPDMPEAQQLILSDAQTSGGLVIAVPAGKRQQMQSALEATGCLHCEAIGYLTKGEPGHVRILG